ncbi:MAG: ATP-dependent RNA helicase HrpA [Nocardioidaceae bacterium]|nr:ATP-dependent RNA helicase HrpA [Nocardioidaceae bacterium]
MPELSAPVDDVHQLHISFPEELPVSARKDDIAAAISEHQVVIVAGETGSGKTTQLPKICLELGRGRDGHVISHTQPRRIAARTVAERIAEELGTELGQVVGYKVRFTDRSSDSTMLKVMTDGILLAEIHRDRNLRRYDTIIVDEAHERSLNIDFILGYLKQLLPRRPDLKVIITSATIDPQRFSAHFDDAPIIEVSGRTYPVEVRYRELEEDQTQGITEAVSELMREGPGDILVFVSGEREIRDATDALKQLQPGSRAGSGRSPNDFDILPLYARLSSAEQHRVFAPHATRRVVLATNVAETSLTVPGIRYVVDTGLARISRFSARTKVQRLPIEPISQASADQRKGRCGRVADGICIRLYGEEDFEARPAFTDPEILRTNLASVILQMTALDLGDMARFPFLEPPDKRAVQAGTQLLEEIGAITTAPPKRRGRRSQPAGVGTTTSDRRTPAPDVAPRLTSIGRKLAQLPVDPRLGRMVLEADTNGCLREVVTIVAALSIQDPRERPTEQQELADQKHRRFADADSDFAGLLNLWRYVKEQKGERSSSAFRRMCKLDFLNYLRIREWQDLDAQLREAAKQLGLKLNSTPAAAEAIHLSLLAGLLSHIGMRDPEKRDYLGARGARFSIFPGSALFKKQPAFVMAAELVETARLWGRVNARIEPEWAESIAAHLVKRSYSEPHWEKKQGAVIALEKVTLYGVPIVTERKVNYGRVDAEAAREIFIRHALVQGEWITQHQFFAHNQALLEEAAELEHRARRRGIVVDDETIFDFYDQRVGPDVVSVAHFDSWWKQARREHPDLLTFSLEMLVHDSAADYSSDDFPDVWRHDGAALPLAYQFEPGTETDGVTVDIPVTALQQVESEDFSWPVPGLREELVIALIRSLPKPLRVNFVPAPDHARAFLAAGTPGAEPLLEALERHLRRTTGTVVQRGDWALDKVPAHLRLSFRVVTEGGDVLGAGKDLDSLRGELRTSMGEAISSAAATVERQGITSWDFGTLPEVFTRTRAGHEVKGYPALVDEGDSVSIRVFGSEGERDAVTRLGLRKLVILAIPSPGARLVKELDNAAKLVLGLSPHGSVTALMDDCHCAAVDFLIGSQVGLDAGPGWDSEDFGALVAQVRSELDTQVQHAVGLARLSLAAAHEIDRRLSGRAELAMLPALSDLKGQWSRLVYPGFVADAGLEALSNYPRYLAAMGQRLDKLHQDTRRDAVLMAQVADVQASYLHQLNALPPAVPPGPALRQIRWLLEELRVSLWAQQLTTPRPISVKRIARALHDL